MMCGRAQLASAAAAAAADDTDMDRLTEYGGTSPDKCLHWEKQRQRARHFSLFDMMVVIEMKEGRLHPNLGSNDV